MKLYGLTCGYWTDDPDDLDNHVIAHARVRKATNLYDLFDEQYRGGPLRQCPEVMC